MYCLQLTRKEIRKPIGDRRGRAKAMLRPSKLVWRKLEEFKRKISAANSSEGWSASILTYKDMEESMVR